MTPPHLVGRRGEEFGASAVEYALLVVAVAAVITTVVYGLGRLVDAQFGNASTSFSNCIEADGSC